MTAATEPSGRTDPHSVEHLAANPSFRAIDGVSVRFVESDDP